MSSSARTRNPARVVVAAMVARYDLVAGQGPASPVHGDVGEQPVLDFVPLRGARREVARGDLQAGLKGESGQLGLPGARAAAVRAARVGGDQQPPGVRVGGAARVVPPAADRLDRELRGVMVGADVHPARVRGQVVDPVWDRLAQYLVGEVVIVDPDRISGGPPFPAAVAVLADQFLLLGVHADHRFPGIAVLPDLLVEVAELGVPVRDLVPLDGLGVALQAEALLPQQVSHRVSAGAVTLPAQLGRQRPQRLRRPPQRRHRITAFIGLHQRQQRRPQARIQVSQPLAAPARPADPAQWLLAPVQLINPLRHRGLPDPCRTGHHPDPAMTQHPRLSTHQQPALPLIQMREDHLELRRQKLPGIHAMSTRPTTSPGGNHGTYGLFIDEP